MPLLLVVGVVLGARGAAWAETPGSPCLTRADLRPRPASYGAPLPVNAPALVFFPPSGWNYHPIADYEIELRDQDPDVVPVTFQAEGNDIFLIRPGRELRGAELTVKYKDFCIPLYGMNEQKVALAPASPLPTTIGTAALRGSFADYGGGTQPPCLPAPVHMVVDVTMSPELAAYRGVARWTVTYNGRTQLVKYGDLQMSDKVAYVQLDDTCGPTTERVGGPVNIAAHVAGATSDPPPLELTVDARCPDYMSPKAPPPCNGGPPEPTNPRPEPGSSIRDGGADAAPPRARGGCALAGSPGHSAPDGGGAAPFWLALLIALAVRTVSKAIGSLR
jgi:hypothetical protein